MQLVVHPAHFTDEVRQRHPRSIGKRLRTVEDAAPDDVLRDGLHEQSRAAGSWTAADAEPDGEAGTNAMGVTSGTPPGMLGAGRDV
jgi:hypothetical protein